MTAIQAIRIVALIDKCEQTAVRIGSELFARSVAAARTEKKQDVTLTFADPEAPPQSLPPANIHVLSLLPELARAREAKAGIRDRWADRIAALQDRADLVFLCTIFRHVRGRDRSGRPDETLVRIRELNLMAIELSHALGVKVIDIDRVLANYGARALDTDYRLSGDSAAGLAGHTIVSALLAGGLDDLIDPVLQEAARTAIGAPENVPALLRALREPRGESSPTDG